MKRIAIVVLALLIVIVSLGISAGCASGRVSVAELSKQLKHCYTLQRSPQNTHAFDQYTVKDLKITSRTSGGLPGSTRWSVTAKLYDASGQFVDDMAGNLIQTPLGWLCQ